MPGVLLLGACREEDYHPELAVGRTTIVDPKLDRRLAKSIAETLANRQVLTVRDVAEAFDAFEGLLMEFLSMLLTGRRLQQVVEEQVAARMVEERATERETLRYVATAHAAGVSLPAEVLPTLIPGRDLAPALSLLHREHILVSDDESRWQGLHELRSTIARDYLHQFPPPTAATTMRHLVKHLPARDSSRIIESYALIDADLESAAEAVSEIFNSRDVGADDGAQLVASLAMADAFRHARECLRVVEDLRPKRLDPESALLVAYTHRFAGVSFDSLKDISPGFSHMIEMAAALPERQASLRDLSLRDLSSQTARDIAVRGTPDQAIAWLESLEGSVAGAARGTRGRVLLDHPLAPGETSDDEEIPHHASDVGLGFAIVVSPQYLDGGVAMFGIVYVDVDCQSRPQCASVLGWRIVELPFPGRDGTFPFHDTGRVEPVNPL